MLEGPTGHRGVSLSPHLPTPGHGGGQPRQPALCQTGSAGVNTISLEESECLVPTHSTDPRLPSAAPSSPGDPWVRGEKMSPATPRHPFDITIHQAAAPLDLLLSQKSREVRNPSSLGLGSPATLPVLPGWSRTPLLGVGGPCIGQVLRKTFPCLYPCRLKSTINIPPPPLPHRFPIQNFHSSKTWATPPMCHLPCIPLRPPA